MRAPRVSTRGTEAADRHRRPIPAIRPVAVLEMQAFKNANIG